MPRKAAQRKLDATLLWSKNGVATPIAEVPELDPVAFKTTCVDACTHGARLAVLCALRVEPRGDARQVIAVLADDAQSRLGLLRMRLPAGRSYAALTNELAQAQAFERELFEQHGITPEGHPWLKPLRRHTDLESPPGAPYPFFQVDGPDLHEVAVGPVHAGIIEPGHFRLQCYGETVKHLEIQLGYQHRGALPLLLTASPARRMVIAESVAGDTAIGHGLAHCMVMEALSGAEPPLAAHSVRGIALELERLANHVGDLAGLCNDVGYLPGAAWFGRLRGEFLNLLMELSGNRFGRGLLLPGGVRFTLTAEQRSAFLSRLRAAGRDTDDTAQLTFDTATVCSRFEHTGSVTRELAERLGLVGPVARASACDRDVRRDHPFGIFRFAHIPVAVIESGDVMARALVRWVEMQRSLVFLCEQLAETHDGPLSIALAEPPAQRLAVAMVEGWRGEIAHLAVSGAGGTLADYHIIDPSFHNWFGLAQALRGNQISDFPLCNKSFSLSYAGHDL